MNKTNIIKDILIGGLLGILLLGCASEEKSFKNLCSELNELGNKVSSQMEKNQIGNSDDIKLFKLINNLHKFSDDNLESKWSDDALYISVTLSSRYGKEKQGLEELLTKFPNLKIEEWTANNLDWMISKDPQFSAYYQLLWHYKVDKDEKLKSFYEDCLKKLPKYESAFTMLIEK